MKYARVVVDIPVAQVDKIYEYIIPDKLKGEIE